MPTPTRRHGLATARHIAVDLTPQAIEQIASRVAQLLRHQPFAETRGPSTPEWMTVKELAHHLKLNPAWVYEHAQELGAIRTGTGPKARIRFDLHTATEALKRHERQTTPAIRPRRTSSLAFIRGASNRGAFLRELAEEPRHAIDYRARSTGV